MTHIEVLRKDGIMITPKVETLPDQSPIESAISQPLMEPTVNQHHQISEQEKETETSKSIDYSQVQTPKSLRDLIAERIITSRKYGRKPIYDDLLGLISINKSKEINYDVPRKILPEVEVELEGRDLEYYNALNDVNSSVRLLRGSRNTKSSPLKRKRYDIAEAIDNDSGTDSEKDKEGNRVTTFDDYSDDNYAPPVHIHQAETSSANGGKRPVGRPRKKIGDPVSSYKKKSNVNNKELKEEAEPGVKRGPGRPRKIKTEAESLSPKIKRGRGRPRKNPFELHLTTELITNVENYVDGEEDSDAETRFIFHRDPSKPITKRLARLSRLQRLDKEQRINRTEVFSSPQKKRIGTMELLNSPQFSPPKKGIISLSGSSPIRSPFGRAGSPRKVQTQMLQDRSAKKRANRTLYAKLLDDGIREDDSDDEANIAIAEKIIADSKDESNGSTSFSSPVKSPKKLGLNQLPTNNPNFVPTALPTTEQDESFFDGKYMNPALFLDGSDGYFDQHRVRPKLSLNSMVQAPKVNYDEFNSLTLLSGYLYHQKKKELNDKYKRFYVQWLFELKEGFNIVFYGIGSKRLFLLSFVEEFLLNYIDVPVVVVNGYNSAVSFKEIISEIISILKLTSVPKKYNDSIEFLVDYFRDQPNDSRLILMINNLDGENLRDDKIQSYLSRISAIKQIHLVCSIDHINAPLLWDAVRLSNFNFVWHNVTNFTEYLTEISFHDPLSLGQTTTSAGSKGAKYVLSSLTNSSRSLYRVLASNQLQNMEDEIAEKTSKQQSVADPRGSVKHALEFTHFFHLCAEEFIASNEINFRTMLMEFVEHKMAVLTRDASGTEQVFIPFTMEEIAKLLEEELL